MFAFRHFSMNHFRFRHFAFAGGGGPSILFAPGYIGIGLGAGFFHLPERHE